MFQIARTSCYVMFSLLVLCSLGCQSKNSIGTRKLASYANLYAQHPTTLVYMQSDVSLYNAFLIEPAHYRIDAKTKVRSAKLRALASQLQQTIHQDLLSAGYSLVNKPQPGVVRIRIVLAQTSSSSSVYAQTKDHVTQGLTPGQAVVEAEILSLDGTEQLGALVIAPSQPVKIKDLLDEKTANDIFKSWAKQLRLQIDDMHGRSSM
ncbi:MAG: DUF3313 family protein [Phycisphaeraceae bacterium]|nr:DUF3313 family protein [Phycisphaeraceae bacterium]